MSTRSGTVRVLHVDDDAAFAETAADFLEREDDRLAVETEDSADAGIERLSEGGFDCVVSDYDMPGTNGIAFLEAVRETHPELPFVLFTGKGSEEIASDAISAGVTDYLQKESGTDQYAILANRITNAVSARRATTAADRTRHRLQQILKTVPACIVQLDYEGNFTFANDRAIEVLGLERSDVTGRAYNDPEWTIRDLDGNPIPDEELPFRRVRDTGEPLYGFRHTIEWPDGTRKVLAVNGAPLFDDGNVERVVFALSDITDEYEYETRLRRTAARLEAQQEATVDGVLVVDESGEIVSYNDRFVEMWDIPEEVIAAGDDEAALEYAIDQLADPEEFYERVQYLYEHPTETSRDEIELVDGRVFDRYSAPVIGDDGTHYGRLWTYRDITER